MPPSIPDTAPSSSVALALEILQVFQKHASTSGIDPLQRLDASEVPLGRPYLIATKAAEELLQWARENASEIPSSHG